MTNTLTSLLITTLVGGASLAGHEVIGGFAAIGQSSCSSHHRSEAWLSLYMMGWSPSALYRHHSDRADDSYGCLLYTSPSPRDISGSRMPSSA